MNRDPSKVGIFPCGGYLVLGFRDYKVSFHMRKTSDKVLVCDAQDISIYEHVWGPCIATLEPSGSPARRFYDPLPLHFLSSVWDIAVGLIIVCFVIAVSLLQILCHLKANDPIESVCSLSLSFINARSCWKCPHQLDFFFFFW